ncbi:MAG: RHS repeat-associated core domain-containing protein [Bacteroidaceae bacterium]|nr:RHS repeat-associated core domain-containing protein [Bacteroidaceae bacterium]
MVKNRLYNSNNRAVINEFGVVRQVTNYYPFGGVFSTTAYNHGDDLQPYKYNGKELDRTHGLDWYDYGARNYDATLCQFTTIDPLCEKYYHISPYAYCANNPVLLIDPDGRYFDFSNCSEEYIKKFEAWGEMLRDAGCGDLYDKIANSDYKVTVFESYNANNSTSVDGLEYEMFFDVDSYAETNNGTIVSPALMLDHELAHLNNAIEAPLVHAIQANNVLFCGKYDNQEEYTVITTREQNTARCLGEIGIGEVTRADHRISRIIDPGLGIEKIIRDEKGKYHSILTF